MNPVRQLLREQKRKERAARPPLRHLAVCKQCRHTYRHLPLTRFPCPGYKLGISPRPGTCPWRPAKVH